MQLRSHAQKYTPVQIIHICIIYTPCVNQRMWTGLKSNILVWMKKECACEIWKPYLKLLKKYGEVFLEMKIKGYGQGH